MWPEFFPESCPPDEAQPAMGEVYRFVNGNPPEYHDFLSHMERGLPFDQGRRCHACGMSVFTELSEAVSAWQAIPGMRRKGIARGVLEEHHGVLENTPTDAAPSHHTWWKPDGVHVAEAFEVLADPQVEGV